MRNILDKLTRKNKDQSEKNSSPNAMKDEGYAEDSTAVSKSESSADEDSQSESTAQEIADSASQKEVQFSDNPPNNEEEEVNVTTNKNDGIEETAVGLSPLTIVAAKEIDSSSRERPKLKVGQSCHVGNVRGRNEDSIFVLNTFSGGEEPHVPFGLYIVADGMGGHHAGHKASKIASTLMARDVTEQIFLPLISNEIKPVASPQRPIGEVMLGAIKTANIQIYSPDPAKEGGTTLTAALIIGRRLYVAHVGDSRAYLLTNNEFTQVTTDHSYVKRLIDAGQITEEEAALHPQRNMLYRAVGGGGDLEVETFTQTLPDHGSLIICSDGLWGLVPDSVIENELLGNSSLQDSADSLVDYALNMGGHDNISIIIVDFTF